jgi:predicted PurR-regulated permease PerM
MLIGSQRPSGWVLALLVPLIILAWLALIVVLGWALSHVVRTLLTLILSGVIAYALTPMVSLLARWMPRWLAILLTYLIGFVVVLGLLGLVVVTAAAQVSSLAHALPGYANEAQQLQPLVLRVLQPLGVGPSQLQHARDSAVTSLEGAASIVAQSGLGIVQAVLGGVVDGVLILILSVYLTANGPGLGRWMRAQTPGRQRWRTRELIGTFNQVIGGYVRGTITMATLVGVLVGVGMAVLRVRYALLLGVLAFFMEFIPIVGVIVSGAVCVLVAVFQGWLLALFVVIYFGVVHVIEGDVVGPRVMGNAVGIHPAVALLALVAGSELFGLWGALFGAPLAGLLQALGTTLWRELRPSPVEGAVDGMNDAAGPPPAPPRREAVERRVPTQLVPRLAEAVRRWFRHSGSDGARK